MGSTRFTDSDILKLQSKGLVVNDPVIDIKLKKAFGLPLKKQYSNKEKDHIEFVLIGMKLPYVKEHKFLENRKFRFDFSLAEHKIAIEYNGIMSEKSRHTSIVGYSVDLTKVNLAQINGWIVLQYTPLTYKQVYDDITTLLNLWSKEK